MHAQTMRVDARVRSSKVAALNVKSRRYASSALDSSTTRCWCPRAPYSGISSPSSGGEYIRPTSDAQYPGIWTTWEIAQSHSPCFPSRWAMTTVHYLYCHFHTQHFARSAVAAAQRVSEQCPRTGSCAQQTPRSRSRRRLALTSTSTWDREPRSLTRR